VEVRSFSIQPQRRKIIFASRLLSRRIVMKRFLGSVLARNTLWMVLGLGSRLILQAAYFTVIARSLGANNYGAFIGVVALVGIVFPFGTLGSGNLLVKNVSRDKTLFAMCWGQALLITLACTSFLFAAVVVLSHLLLPPAISVRLVLLVSGADLFGLSIITLCGNAFQALERLKWTAAINVLISASRLSGALILVSIHGHPSALQWGYLYCCSTAAVVITSLVLVSAKLGWPRFNWPRSASEFREGFYFSVSLSAQTVYNDIDKTMLARIGTLDATGIYGAAYRLIDAITVPITSLRSAAYPNFFRKGAAGIAGSIPYANRLTLRALGSSALISLTLLLFAGAVPYVLGQEYTRAVEALRWLAVLPILRALHYFYSDALSGAGHQGLRTSIQAGVAVFNVFINLWLIPAYSWRGAAWSSLASDGLLAGGVGIAVLALRRRSVPVLVESKPVQLATERVS
jgi:O-antigen/teichoic acid export membrane protein